MKLPKKRPLAISPSHNAILFFFWGGGGGLYIKTIQVNYSWDGIIVNWISIVLMQITPQNELYYGIGEKSE